MTDFIFLGSQITADGDCSLEIKRRLLLGGSSLVAPNVEQSLIVGLETDPSSCLCHSEHLSVRPGLPLGLLSDSNVHVFRE